MPFSKTTLAKNGPAPYIQIGVFAPRIISAVAQTSDEGALVPPISSGVCRLQKPDSIQVS